MFSCSRRYCFSFLFSIPAPTGFTAVDVSKVERCTSRALVGRWQYSILQQGLRGECAVIGLWPGHITGCRPKLHIGTGPGRRVFVPQLGPVAVMAMVKATQWWQILWRIVGHPYLCRCLSGGMSVLACSRAVDPILSGAVQSGEGSPSHEVQPARASS